MFHSVFVIYTKIYGSQLQKVLIELPPFAVLAHAKYQQWGSSKKRCTLFIFMFMHFLFLYSLSDFQMGDDNFEKICWTCFFLGMLVLAVVLPVYIVGTVTGEWLFSIGVGVGTVWVVALIWVMLQIDKKWGVVVTKMETLIDLHIEEARKRTMK